MNDQNTATNYHIGQQIIALEQRLQRLAENQSQQKQDFLEFTQKNSNIRGGDQVEDLFLDYYQNDQEDLNLHSNQSLILPIKSHIENSESTIINDKAESHHSIIFDINQRGKKIKKVNACEHSDKPHYAKQMCRSCYSKYGRLKKPWRCNHEKLYAQGLCQLCYTNTYNRIRRTQRENDQIEINHPDDQ